jgi:signal transduction histidine kinase
MLGGDASGEGPQPRIDGSVNILIVDDEPKNLAVLESVLDDPQYRLVRANSGEEALLALMADEFAVLVLDVRMPGMTGFEVAQLVKQRRRTARVPIIFLTAYYNEDQHILEGYGTGAVDYLHKPVNASVLRSKVAVFAELHKKGRAVEAANRSLLAEVAERRRAEARLAELNESLDQRVTERTAALQHSEARLMDANRRKDEFLATLAHELRNPLAPVRNAVQLLTMQGGQQSAEQLRWAAELIDRQVRAMSRLIDDLMDVSRINQNRIELRRDVVDLQDVLNDAIETTRPLIDEQRHKLVVKLPPVAIRVDVDRTRLSQAFMNLLNNAAKYMDAEGEIHVYVKTEGEIVSVTFKDSGIGIPQAHIDNVFEMFSQVESAISRSRGGLGIGLSLTQKLVQLHGGTVRAFSEGVGKGSRFVVELPVAGRALRRVPASLPTAVAKADQFRILVADDNKDAAETLAVVLQTLGHTVHHVNDGEAAISAVETFDPQVVLLDIGMPKLNGYEVCRRIRAQAGGPLRTLVAITGWGQPEDMESSGSAGFDHHLVKPVDISTLSKLIANLVPQRKH